MCVNDLCLCSCVCGRKRTLWMNHRRLPPRRNRPGRFITNSNCFLGSGSTFYMTDSPCLPCWTGRVYKSPACLSWIGNIRLPHLETQTFTSSNLQIHKHPTSNISMSMLLLNALSFLLTLKL